MGVLDSIDLFVKGNDVEDAVVSGDNTNHDNIPYDKEFWNAGKAYEREFTEKDADATELEMGIKIEMEHTTNAEISKKIALDHLSEISDYYTRLAKMESSAKE